MSVAISGKYTGGLGVELTHGPSGAVIKTAAPVDNQGDGSSFSPTDMVAAGLGACMLTIMGIVGQRDELDLSSIGGLMLILFKSKCTSVNYSCC